MITVMVYENEEKCIHALNQNWEAIKDMPAMIITEAIALTAIKKSWQSIMYIANHLLTQEMCLIALSQCWKSIMWVPQDMITEEMGNIAVKQNWLALRWIPQDIRNEEMGLNALKQNWTAIIYIEDITEEMWIIALKQDFGLTIKLVPYVVLQSDSFYSALIASDFSIPCHENIPAVFYENYVKAIWAEYDEPRAMREIIKRCLNKV
jgi:hypothetical protein